ncbi:antitoxin [Humibacillus xanthopallidus]|uniref:antitoxin n=1 Tax=Humibacillus xanthopallidus TaxID=412689 RepID=UPI00384CADFC
MSDWIQKAKDFVKGNPEQAGQGLDKAEEFINERTGGKYADKLDQGTDKVREGLGLPPEAENAPGTDAAPADAPPVDPAPEIPPSGEPAGEQGLPGVPDPNLPGSAEGDITLGEPPQPPQRPEVR